MAKDAESGKVKKGSKGLGKWICGECHKKCKVTPSKPEGNMASLSCPDVIYPAKLQTPVLNVHVEVTLGKTDVTPNIT
jgi:hypothetical protein